MYLAVTHVDADTGVVCTAFPMRTGPAFPAVKGYAFQWANESQWPIATTPRGVYVLAPMFFGLCDDDADTSLPGVLATYSEAEYLELKQQEFRARRHPPSWVFDESSLKWGPPIPYPQDGQRYHWDEQTISWAQVQIPA